MRILIVKMSSLGDLVHAVSVVKPILETRPDLHFDWLVEEEYAQLLETLCPNVGVIPIAIRRWRRQLWKKTTQSEVCELSNLFRLHQWDLIIDAQGLIKSALASCWAARRSANSNVPIVGYDAASVRERLASVFYHRRLNVSKNKHAIDRLDSLIKASLPKAKTGVLSWSDETKQMAETNKSAPYLIFIMGSSWVTKKYPLENWARLAERAKLSGLKIKVTWGNESERAEVKELQSHCSNVELIPKMDVSGLLPLLKEAAGVISVDTGLGHLSAMEGVPTIGLFSASGCHLTSIRGKFTANFQTSFACSPCFKKQCPYQREGRTYVPCWRTLSIDEVWLKMIRLINEKEELREGILASREARNIIEDMRVMAE